MCMPPKNRNLSGGGTAAETEYELPAYHIAEVVVEGRRYIAGEYVLATNNLGILGKVDAMDFPISVNSISEKAVGNFMSSTEGFSKMLSLVPSVQKTYDAAVDCITIRGFADDGRGFTVNGIPGMQAMTRQSTIYIDSVDVIEGPTTGVTGSSYTATDGGTININSKKAKDTPTRRFGIKYHANSSHEEFLDVGERFGKNKAFGVRVNASHTNGERSIENWSLRQESIYVNLDHKSRQSTTNFMIGYTYTDSQGRPYGLTVPTTYIGDALPSAPDGKINFNPVWRRDKNTNFVMTLNHEHRLNNHLRAFLNAGHFKQDWYYYVGFSKTLLNQAGDYTATSDNYSLIEKKDYVQIGLRGDFRTGNLKHNYVLGVDRQWRYYGGPSDFKEESGWSSNIYHPNTGSFAPPTFGQSDAYYGSRSRASGWSVMDTITSTDKKLTVLLGVSGKSIHRDSYRADGSWRRKDGDYYAVSPIFGINYTFTPRFSAYINHTEQFTEGSIVGSTYQNQGETIDPLKTKQNEIGIKVKTGDFLHKLSWFDITKTNTVSKDVPGFAKPFLVAEGDRRHRGIEYMGTGSIAEKWNLIGGFMHLTASQKTNSASTNGKRPNGMPDWTATLGLEYKANEDVSGLLRLNYVGSSYVLNEKYNVPSYFTMDMGIKYRTKINRVPLTLNAMCYNVFNKHYWNATGNVLHLGGPRTFMLSAAIDF